MSESRDNQSFAALLMESAALWRKDVAFYVGVSLVTSMLFGLTMVAATRSSLWFVLTVPPLYCVSHAVVVSAARKRLVGLGKAQHPLASGFGVRVSRMLGVSAIVGLYGAICVLVLGLLWSFGVTATVMSGNSLPPQDSFLALSLFLDLVVVVALLNRYVLSITAAGVLDLPVRQAIRVSIRIGRTRRGVVVVLALLLAGYSVVAYQLAIWGGAWRPVPRLAAQLVTFLVGGVVGGLYQVTLAVATFKLFHGYKIPTVSKGELLRQHAGTTDPDSQLVQTEE